MATNITFIDSTYVKNNSIVAQNVDSTLIDPLIGDVQDIRIEPLIGSGLYTKCISEINSYTNDDGEWTGSTTNDYKILIDTYIAPCLKNYVLFELVPYSNFKFSDKSIVTQESDNSAAVGLDVIEYLSQRILINARGLGERMIKHIQANISLYPEYNQVSGIDGVVPNTSAYDDSDIFIPSRGYRIWNKYGGDCCGGELF